PDNAKARRADELDAAITLARTAGDECVHRRGEAELRGLGRYVVHAPIGDEQRARDAIRRHVGERRAKRIEKARAIGLAVRLSGLDRAHFEARDAAEPLVDCGTHRLSLLLTIAEVLARA